MVTNELMAVVMYRPVGSHSKSVALKCSVEFIIVMSWVSIKSRVPWSLERWGRVVSGGVRGGRWRRGDFGGGERRGDMFAVQGRERDEKLLWGRCGEYRVKKRG